MCGIAGLVAQKSNNKLLRTVITAMMVLQSRGNDGCGIACSDGNLIKIKKGLSKVSVVFAEQDIIEMNKLKPLIIVGHNLYTTSGLLNMENVHPLYFKIGTGKGVFAYNGNVPNLKAKRDGLVNNGAVFESDGDTEFIFNYIFEAADRHWSRLVQGIKKFMLDIPAAYSASLMVREKLFLFRDPRGFRPLVYGWIGNTFVYASEDSALKKIGAKRIKEVEPGVIMEIGIDNSLKVYRVFTKNFCNENTAHCIFSGIYFARPDSKIFGELEVDVFRQLLGAKLYEQCNLTPDVITPVPDSGNQGAIGYAIRAKRHLQNLLLKDPTVDRTFTAPGQRNRENKAKLKYSLLVRLIRQYFYKTIMIIDDSIVRSTTMRILIKRIKNLVKKKLKRLVEIHVGVLSPPIKYPCLYGIDMKTSKELIAADKNIGEIQEIIGADGLYYLTIENLKQVMLELDLNPDNYCMACFDGKYPIKIK